MPSSLILPRYYKGQYKRPGVPRIDWTHPLAAELCVYIYDTGGAKIDLVNGGMLLAFFGTAPPGNQSTPWGQAFNGGPDADASLQQTTALTASTPASHPYNFARATPFTAAAAFYWTESQSTSAAICGTCDDSNNQGIFFWSGGGQSQGGGGWITANGGGASDVIDYQTNFPQHTFNTAMLVAAGTAGAGTAALYQNGVINFTTTPTSLIFDLSGVHTYGVTFGTDTYNVGQSPNGLSNSYCYYFAGWRRALSSDEARQLHDDPYCFLIYPEDDIFSTWVGSAFTLQGGTALIMM